MASSSCDIIVIGGGMSARHAAEDAVKGGWKVAHCMGNPFMEFPMGACIFLNDPEKHQKFLCGNPEKFELKGVTYVFDVVTDVDADRKVVGFKSGCPELSYKALIVATGSKLPLFSPRLGDDVAARMAEVKAVAAAIKQADTVVVNGAGAVGVEMVGDIRAKHPHVKITLLSRTGGVVQDSTSDVQRRVMDTLRGMRVKVVKGSAPADCMEPKLKPGTVMISNGEVQELKYDVFIPAFAQGPNTDFLRSSGTLNERGQIVATECLQSTARPEIFGVSVTTQPLLGHPGSSRVTAQARTCAANAKLLLEGKAPKPHVDKEGPPVMKAPMNIKIGHGQNGYLIWQDLGPARFLCFQPGGGGFPFCPPPCCWCCASGCATCLGNCCGPAEGEGAARFMEGFLLPNFMGVHGYLGAGELPPEMQKMK